MNVKRRKGLACSSPLGPDSQLRQKPKGKVYNIFPYIEDPRHIDEGNARAYTLLGFFEAIFFPVIHKGPKDSALRDEVDRLLGTTFHEIAHWILGRTMVTWEERAIATALMGGVWGILLGADSDVRLLIPSFTIVGPAGKDFELGQRAERLYTLIKAREAVHEIVARAIQVESQGWDRGKAKQLIRQEVGSDLLDRKTLESFLHVYEYEMGAIGACLLGQYALNELGLTQQSALARFKRATEVASTFKAKDRQYTSPRTRLANYLLFMQHLDSNLPDFNMAHYPPAEACLPTTIERVINTWANSFTNRSREDGNPVPSFGERATQENEVLPDSVREILSHHDPEALSVLGYEREEPTGRSFRFLMLVEHDNRDCKYTVGVTREEKDQPLVEFAPETFSTFVLEAPLQQMMYGEGPLCLCYPHQPVNCIYRPLLQRLWDYTQPDPEWENNWKLPKNKPRCIE